MLELAELRRRIGMMLRLVGPMTERKIQGRLKMGGERIPIEDVRRGLQSMAASGDAEKDPDGRWHRAGALARAPSLPRGSGGSAPAAAPPTRSSSRKNAPYGKREADILAAITANGPLAPGEIARITGIPIGSLYMWLAKMASAGHLVRRGPNNRRRYALPPPGEGAGASERRVVVGETEPAGDADPPRRDPDPGPEPPCHALTRDQWCDRRGAGDFMGHTCGGKSKPGMDQTGSPDPDAALGGAAAPAPISISIQVQIDARGASESEIGKLMQLLPALRRVLRGESNNPPGGE